MDKKKPIMIGIILITIAMITGVTFALWQINLSQESTNTITTGCFRVTFEEQNPISLKNAYPISKEEGKSLTPYTFTITNTCDSLVNYQVNLEILKSTTLEHFNVIDILLNEKEKNLTEEVEKTLDEASQAYKLETGVLKAKESVTYNLRLWLDENTPATEEYMNKIFNSKITVTVTHLQNLYTEPILNGMNPVLKDELVPVTIDSNGTVHKADIEKEWYKYENKEWANAVILTSDAKEYQNNEVIPEENIESYFVWIPKYRYQLWNLEEYPGLTIVDESKIHEIPVIFGDYNTTDSVSGECTTPMTSGNIGNCEEGDYMTHPAFLSIPSNGFWVGKFETSKSNSNSDNSINPTGVQIKPNVSSWRNIQAGNAFYTSYEYKRNLDSHMMKNTEWGAVAYLQHSKYGSQTSVRFNNNSNYITGYASVNEPTCGSTGDNRDCNRYGTASNITLPYNTSTGVLASTTGNITGIYDMSGGAWEHAMCVMIDENGNPLSGGSITYNSGFKGSFVGGNALTNGFDWPEEKYYDSYAYNPVITNYTKRIIGDATGEMGPFKRLIYANNLERLINSWYGDTAGFINTNPWFDRGGAYGNGINAGIFTFGSTTGSAGVSLSFRIILTI